MSDKVKLSRAVELISKLSIDKASQVFSKLIKSGARIELEKAYVADISEATAKIAADNNEVVGVYVDIVGDIPLKFLFYVDVPGSLVLSDLIMRRAVGTTKQLDELAKSAVQEIGNILASAVSNVFAADFQVSIKPTPPIVVHDYLGTVFEEYLMEVAVDKDEIMIIESTFFVVKDNIKSFMFILPVHGSEKILNYIVDPAGGGK